MCMWIFDGSRTLTTLMDLELLQSFELGHFRQFLQCRVWSPPTILNGFFRTLHTCYGHNKDVGF